ncbi:MAG TPA: bifunctional DNA primase/polymerase, partial [Methanothrix soehngenii]|nr:bifunctional DNA primase/polymerase [Methanothrix soehngenii]
MAAITLPSQLSCPGYRFIKLGWGGKWLKFPIELGWNIFDIEELKAYIEKKQAQWDEAEANGKHEEIRAAGKYVPKRPVFRGRLNNYAFDDPEFIDWLQRGNNYGVTGAGGLIKLESDDMPRWRELGVIDLLSEGFTVKSSTPTRQHFYFDYDGPGIADTPLKDPVTGKDIGHIRAMGEPGGRGGQVVGPGSLHPHNVRYEVIKDMPIARIDRATLDKVIAKFGGKQTGESKKAGKTYLIDPFSDVTIAQVLGGHYHDFHPEGSQMAGPNPYGQHTNHAGRCLVIEPGDKEYYCFECEQGGGVSRLIAIKAGIMRCDERGSPTGRAWWDTIRFAVKDGLISEETAKAAGLDRQNADELLTEAEALLLADDLRKKVNTDPGAPFEEKYTQALAVLQLANPAEYQRIMADLKGKTSIRDLKKAVKQASASMGAAKRRAKAEASGLKLEDICNVDYDEKGNVSSVTLAPTRAAAAIEEYLTLAMSKDSDEIYYFDNGIYHTGGDRLIDLTLCGEAGDAVDIKQLNEVLRRVKNSLLCEPVIFDPDPYLLGCKNGVVDLRTGEFRDYLPSDYITDQIAVTYNKTAKCVRFLQFLEEVLPNPVDRLMLIDWFAAHAIREMLPYVMFLLGLGRNGKGIFERLLKKFFKDESFSEMQLEELKVKNNRFAGAALKGMRGQIVSEAGEEQRTSTKKVIPTSFLKFSTGDGTIDSDQKREKRVRFKPFHKATLDFNDMPIIADMSKGWTERFCKADMPFSYVDNPDPTNPLERMKDPHLFEKLTTDEELSGILNLIISRAPAIIKTKTITKRPGAEMFAEYQRQSSSVLTFLEIFCDYKLVSDSKNDIFLDMIFEKYEQWCDLTVADKVDAIRFGKSVKAFC